MAKKPQIPKANEAGTDTPGYSEPTKPQAEYDYNRRVYSDFKHDLDAHDNYITDFDAYEAMLMSRTYDSVSRQTKNGLTDSATRTLYLERAARVVSQLPTGNLTAAGKKDEGKAALMNIILQKWIYPNANSQSPLLQKLRQWQFYSSVYNYMLMHYDWTVREDGYIGPDCWLWSPRNFVPPIGYANIDDMPYANAIAYCDAQDIEAWLEEDDSAGWDKEALNDLLTRLKKDPMGQKTDNTSPDSKRDSYITRQRQSSQPNGKFMAVTRYEAGEDGHWVTFAPELQKGIDGVLRDIPNPHENGKIPFVKKSCIPTYDNFYDLGDFQAAKPIQLAMDGLTNFYFMGIKRNILPPLVVNPNGVVKHTVSQEANSIILENVPNSVKELTTSTNGMNTYQSTMTQFKGSLLNQAGTTDTTATQGSSLDPGFGKTPQAIQSLQQRQGARDNQDLFYLESAIETLVNRMIGLIPVMATETIPIDLFSDDVKDIVDAGYPDVKDMLQVSSSGQSARLNIKPSALKGATYRFTLDDSSTIKQSKADQLTALQQFGSIMSSNQNILTQLQDQGMTYDVGQYAQLVGYLADIPQMQQLVRPMTDQEKQALQQSQQQENQPKDPSEQLREQLDYKDVAATSPVDAAAMLKVAGLPGDVDTITQSVQQQSANEAAKNGSAQVTSGQPQSQSQQAPAQPVTVGNQQFNDPEIAQAAQQLAGQAGGQQ
jgi:hypothetical protein